MILSLISDLQTGVSLGKVCYERGRLLTLCPSMETQAEQFLGRASKFNIPGAWTLLGESLYGRGDLPGAATCFNRALSAVSLNISYCTKKFMENWYSKTRVLLRLLLLISSPLFSIKYLFFQLANFNRRNDFFDVV